MRVDWKIPLVSGQPLEITLEAGDQLFIVGANGSGKSALIQHFVSSNRGGKVRRVSAHRRTWLESGSINLTPERRRQFETESSSDERGYHARWRDMYAGERESAVLFDLVAKENARARSIAQHVDNRSMAEAAQVAAESKSPFDQLNELLRLGTLEITLKNSDGEEILARHLGTGSEFSMAQMSDGERNAALIAATVLTVEPGTVLLIDEPERHLHRSIIEPLLTALFEQRTDCAFVVSTHEVALPVANPRARVQMVRSCTWNGEQASAWDIDVLEANSDLPEELKRTILGTRKKILFVEGDAGSLDLPLYDALFPGLSVVAKGNCVDVQKAVTGLRGAATLHDVEGFGLIDGDGRSDNAKARLVANGVFALDVYSAEALYYCSDAIAAVAQRQAESLGCDAEEMIEAATCGALDALSQHGLDQRMAARRCELRLRDQILSQVPDWHCIQTNSEPQVCVSVDNPYPSELNCFREFLSSGNLNELVGRYPLRETGVFDVISKSLHIANRRRYEQTLVERVRSESELANKLRERIGPLAQALEE